MSDSMRDDERQRSSSTYVANRDNNARDEGVSMGKLLRMGLVLGAGYLFVKQLPELQRYLKMRKM